MIAEAEHKTIDFTKEYFLLRKKEGRIYSDDELAKLPDINKQHQYYNEWKIRRASYRRLVSYLNKKNTPLQILEVGCGNGWLSAKLSVIHSAQVVGIDSNAEELSQARRVFQKIDNLDFFNTTFPGEIMGNGKFDVIVFAASIQYFSSLKNVLCDAMSILKPGGEIHILDSHFYKRHEIHAAWQRSKNYFQSIGFPNMAEQYFHHSIDDLGQFDYKILYNPHSLFNKFKQDKNPFYWVRIKDNV